MFSQSALTSQSSRGPDRPAVPYVSQFSGIVDGFPSAGFQDPTGTTSSLVSTPMDNMANGSVTMTNQFMTHTLLVDGLNTQHHYICPLQPHFISSHPTRGAAHTLISLPMVNYKMITKKWRDKYGSQPSLDQFMRDYALYGVIKNAIPEDRVKDVAAYAVSVVVGGRVKMTQINQAMELSTQRQGTVKKGDHLYLVAVKYPYFDPMAELTAPIEDVKESLKRRYSQISVLQQVHLSPLSEQDTPNLESYISTLEKLVYLCCAYQLLQYKRNQNDTTVYNILTATGRNYNARLLTKINEAYTELLKLRKKVENITIPDLLTYVTRKFYKKSFNYGVSPSYSMYGIMALQTKPKQSQRAIDNDAITALLTVKLNNFMLQEIERNTADETGYIGADHPDIIAKMAWATLQKHENKGGEHKIARYSDGNAVLHCQYIETGPGINSPVKFGFYKSIDKYEVERLQGLENQDFTYNKDAHTAAKGKMGSNGSVNTDNNSVAEEKKGLDVPINVNEEDEEEDDDRNPFLDPPSTSLASNTVNTINGATITSPAVLAANNSSPSSFNTSPVRTNFTPPPDQVPPPNVTTRSTGTNLASAFDNASPSASPFGLSSSSSSSTFNSPALLSSTPGVTKGGSTSNRILIPTSIILLYGDKKIPPLQAVMKYAQSDVKWDISTVDEKPFDVCRIALQIKDQKFFTEKNTIKLAINGVENFIPNEVAAEFNESGLMLTKVGNLYVLVIRLKNSITYTKSMILQFVDNDIITFTCTISRAPTPTPAQLTPSTSSQSSTLVPYSAPKPVPVAASRAIANADPVVTASIIPQVVYITSKDANEDYPIQGEAFQGKDTIVCTLDEDMAKKENICYLGIIHPPGAPVELYINYLELGRSERLLPGQQSTDKAYVMVPQVGSPENYFYIYIPLKPENFSDKATGRKELTLKLETIDGRSYATIRIIVPESSVSTAVSLPASSSSSTQEQTRIMPNISLKGLLSGWGNNIATGIANKAGEAFGQAGEALSQAASAVSSVISSSVQQPYRLGLRPNTVTDEEMDVLLDYQPEQQEELVTDVKVTEESIRGTVQKIKKAEEEEKMKIVLTNVKVMGGIILDKLIRSEGNHTIVEAMKSPGMVTVELVLKKVTPMELDKQRNLFLDIRAEGDRGEVLYQQGAYDEQKKDEIKLNFFLESGEKDATVFIRWNFSDDPKAYHVPTFYINFKEEQNDTNKRQRNNSYSTIQPEYEVEPEPEPDASFDFPDTEPTYYPNPSPPPPPPRGPSMKAAVNKIGNPAKINSNGEHYWVFKPYISSDRKPPPSCLYSGYNEDDGKPWAGCYIYIGKVDHVHGKRQNDKVNNCRAGLYPVEDNKLHQAALTYIDTMDIFYGVK